MSNWAQSPDGTYWATRLARWSGYLRAARLQGIVGLVLEAMEPLSPLGAHTLWVAQPALGLLVPREDIASLARLLETPSGMAWLRFQLMGAENEIEHDGL